MLPLEDPSSLRLIAEAAAASGVERIHVDPADVVALIDANIHAEASAVAANAQLDAISEVLGAERLAAADGYVDAAVRALFDDPLRLDYLAAHAWLVSAGLASNDGREHTVAERVRGLVEQRDAAVARCNAVVGDAIAREQQLLSERSTVVVTATEEIAAHFDRVAREWDARRLGGNDAAMLRLCAKDVRSGAWRAKLPGANTTQPVPSGEEEA